MRYEIIVSTISLTFSPYCSNESTGHLGRHPSCIYDNQGEVVDKEHLLWNCPEHAVVLCLQPYGGWIQNRQISCHTTQQPRVNHMKGTHTILLVLFHLSFF